MREFKFSVSSCTDCFANVLDFVAAEIVHHHHISGLERRGQFMFDVGPEDVAIARRLARSSLMLGRIRSLCRWR